MTRVNVFAVVGCTAMLLMVGSVNAQCASCGQAAAPSFSQNYAAPSYAQPQMSYAQPQATYAQPQATYAQPQATYAQPQATYAAPVSNGCSSCGNASFAAPQDYYAGPVSTGCSSCGGSAPAVSYAQPVGSYSAPVNAGCACESRRVARPQMVQRVRVRGQRRNNNCNTCAPCNSCY